MECEQLNRLIKDWYLQKIHETLAPARMMLFIDQHIKNCPICAKDLLLPDEVEKIREFIFPEARLITPIQVENADEEDNEEAYEEESEVVDEADDEFAGGGEGEEPESDEGEEL